MTNNNLSYYRFL